MGSNENHQRKAEKEQSDRQEVNQERVVSCKSREKRVSRRGRPTISNALETIKRKNEKNH